jgi:hypothetical protein
LNIITEKNVGEFLKRFRNLHDGLYRHIKADVGRRLQDSGAILANEIQVVVSVMEDTETDDPSFRWVNLRLRFKNIHRMKWIGDGAQDSIIFEIAIKFFGGLMYFVFETMSEEVGSPEDVAQCARFIAAEQGSWEVLPCTEQTPDF